MMVMKYFEPRIKLDKELEMDIWREANMLESYGASRYGLAFSAVRRGFRARIYTNIRGAGFVKRVKSLVGKVDYRTLNLFLEERRKRSLDLGAKEVHVSEINEDLLRRTLKAGFVPILLSNAEYFDAEDVPHWIVISGIDENRFYAMNPLRKGQIALPLSSLDSVIGYKGDQCMVAISKHK